MTRDEHELLLSFLESFLDDSLITEVLEIVQGGKEATVFRCRAEPSTGHTFFAAKVYRPMERRNFRNDSVYQQGRVIVNRRTRVAFEKGTAFGREVQQGRWVGTEFATQQMLFDLGADVPRPIKSNGSAILMQWIGDENGASPQLRHAKFDRTEAINLCDRLLANIELMLRNNIVHGDLSPFNVLYVGGDAGVKIIDFPQAIDPRTNPSACDLLHRDVENICRFFEKFGVQNNPYRIAADWWKKFLYAEL